MLLKRSVCIAMMLCGIFSNIMSQQLSPQAQAYLARIGFSGAQPVIEFYNTTDPYYQFTNFWDKDPIKLDGQIWNSSEHYFQAQKFIDPSTGGPLIYQGTNMQDYIRTTPTPRAAFDAARKYDVLKRKDWDQAKDGIMLRVLREKFTQHDSLKKLLLGTGNALLIEAAPPDYYWGSGANGTGQNKLGLTLMQVRGELSGRVSPTPAAVPGQGGLPTLPVLQQYPAAAPAAAPVGGLPTLPALQQFPAAAPAYTPPPVTYPAPAAVPVAGYPGQQPYPAYRPATPPSPVPAALPAYPGGPVPVYPAGFSAPYSRPVTPLPSPAPGALPAYPSPRPTTPPSPVPGVYQPAPLPATPPPVQQQPYYPAAGALPATPPPYSPTPLPLRPPDLWTPQHNQVAAYLYSGTQADLISAQQFISKSGLDVKAKNPSGQTLFDIAANELSKFVARHPKADVTQWYLLLDSLR